MQGKRKAPPAWAGQYCHSYSFYSSLSVNSFLIWSCTWLHLHSSS
nr:MAG TPA: hypothetical protein [Caudoviricetes sp.]